MQKPNSYVTECTHTLAYVVMKGLNSARAHLEYILSLHDSVDLKCIKSDRKIQDMEAENVYIYVSYDSNHTKSAVFFLKK